jgi:hypothetical protein
MGVRLPSVFATGPNGVTVAAGTETVLYTLGPISPMLEGAAVFLFCYSIWQLGTATTSVAQRIRRGVGGTVVNTVTSVIATAGNLSTFSMCYVDTPGNSADLQYVYSVQQNGSTQTNGLSDGAFIAMIL